jgi:hypothetical protein
MQACWAYYDDSALDVTPTLREHAAFDADGFVVERLGDLRFNETENRWARQRAAHSKGRVFSFLATVVGVGSNLEREPRT